MRRVNLYAGRVTQVAATVHHHVPVHSEAFPNSLFVLWLVGAWLGFLIPVIFIVRYSMLTKWWHHPAGQTIVALDSCLVLLFGQALTKHYLWHDEPEGLAAWVIITAVFSVSIIVAYRLICMEKRCIDRKKEQKHIH